MNRGSVPFDHRIDPQRLAELLADALRDVEAKDVTVSIDRVSFSGGTVRLLAPWNVLSPFGRSELFVNVFTGRLEYTVSFRQLGLFLIAISVFFVVAMTVARFPLGAFPLALAMIWLWLGGMNVLISRIRFEQFLREVIVKAAGKDG
jgi:hypothetical protein